MIGGYMPKYFSTKTYGHNIGLVLDNQMHTVIVNFYMAMHYNLNLHLVVMI